MRYRLENVTQVGVAHLNEALTQLSNLQKLHLNFKRYSTFFILNPFFAESYEH